MKKYILTLSIISFTLLSFGQYRGTAGVAVGENATMFSVGAEREFNVISKKLHINPGVRLNVFNASDLDYITAPAEYTSTDEQVDTLFMPTIQNNFANVYVRIGYDITEKLSLSFDIDVVGVSFGSEQKENDFTPGAAAQSDGIPSVNDVASDPTVVNLLLVGDRDLGSLNSTLSLSYDLTQRIGIDAGLGLVFTEYTTQANVGYDGNDRFRNKNMMGYLGISFGFGK